MAGSSEVSIGRMRKGQWTQVAVTWDASAVRMYVDGVLYARTTQGPLAWRKGAITNLSVASGLYGHLCWSGMIDEIRVSTVRRYGPFVPKGASPKPLPPAREGDDADPPAQLLKPAFTPEQAAAEQAKLIATVEPSHGADFESKPNSQGDYVYEATSAKPLVSGGRLELENDYQKIKGLSVAVVGETFSRLIGNPVNAGTYWKLGGIAPGKYWVGLLYESNTPWHGQCESPQGNTDFALFLNGRIIQWGSTADPVQDRAENVADRIHPLDAESLKSGDEIEPVSFGGQPNRLVHVLLHAKPPAIGAGRAPLNFGEHWWGNVDTSLRVNPVVLFVDKKGNLIPSRNPWWGPEQVADSAADFMTGADGKPLAYCLLFNPLPTAVTVDFDCVDQGTLRARSPAMSMKSSRSSRTSTGAEDNVRPHARRPRLLHQGHRQRRGRRPSRPPWPGRNSTPLIFSPATARWCPGTTRRSAPTPGA